MYNIPLGTFDQSAKTGSVYDNVQTGYWEALKSNIATTWNYNPLSSLLRTVDQAQAYDSSNVYLKADDLNKEHAELGLVFKKDTRKGVVDYLVERKKYPYGFMRIRIWKGWIFSFFFRNFFC